MIILKRYNKKWRITIGDETWQFDSLDEMQIALNSILNIKDKYGDIRE